MEYQNKQVLIIGLARSGLGAARLLLQHGAMVTICDSKKEETIKADVLNEAAELPVRLLFGTTPDEELLARYDLMILSPGVPTDLPFVLKARDLGLTVWGEVELAYRFCKAPIIGITGTNGKTTTTALTGEIMKAAYPGTEVVGNIGIAFALRAEVPTENDYVVAELSSFQLETIEAFHPHISAVLNITPDHLNRHHTMQAYMEAKQNIYRNQTEEDFCVLNFDDPECLRMAGELEHKPHGPRVIGFSRKTQPEGGIWTENGQIISAIGGVRRPIVGIEEMQIFGAHNEENMLAAIACCLCAGLDPEVIRKAAVQFKGVAHRIEYVGTVNGVPYYNDSKATNTDAAIKGLLAMRSQVVLIGGGMDKKIPFDDWTDLMPGRVRKLLLIGETKEIIRDAALRSGLEESRIEFCSTLEETVEKARRYAEPGDCVLLSPACASWDMFDSFEQRGDLFRAAVQAMEV
ncbi:MAG: UDP-N-acetylmuramoyl-L-alanine--D-glutamate ligase [Clostridiales bacterium]|nr:UDP-N-acetylmuramoyl-L-alanine--D-glutamate ligase [Clostridiales bacterium]